MLAGNGRGYGFVTVNLAIIFYTSNGICGVRVDSPIGESTVMNYSRCWVLVLFSLYFSFRFLFRKLLKFQPVCNSGFSEQFRCCFLQFRLRKSAKDSRVIFIQHLSGNSVFLVSASSTFAIQIQLFAAIFSS